MKHSGSFEIPGLGVGIEGAAVLISNRLNYAYLRALQDYMTDVAKRIPVLTGATRTAALQVLDDIEDKIQESGLPFEPSDVDLEPTTRQVPGSPSYPATPDTTPPYRGKFSPQHYFDLESRQEWRYEAEMYTDARSIRSFSMASAHNGQMDFDFVIITEDQGFNYWADGEPAKYKPEDTAVYEYENKIGGYVQQYVTPALNIFMPKAGQSTFDFGDA